mmetsp:Transcript_6705/g.6022  ORF Transcript_6705/g.6022 Transcript_6705/m.6022 type:complete len:110 (+) Transcript_6705:2233-2562(+)
MEELLHTAPVYNKNMKDVPKDLRIKGSLPIKCFDKETIKDEKERRYQVLLGLYTKNDLEILFVHRKEYIDQLRHVVAGFLDKLYKFCHDYKVRQQEEKAKWKKKTTVKK